LQRHPRFFRGAFVFETLSKINLYVLVVRPFPSKRNEQNEEMPLFFEEGHRFSLFFCRFGNGSFKKYRNLDKM
jgi:hypothetical protein